MLNCVPGVLDEDPDHHDKDDNVEDQDGKDGSQKGTKKHTNVIDEATGVRKENASHPPMSSC